MAKIFYIIIFVLPLTASAFFNPFLRSSQLSQTTLEDKTTLKDKIRALLDTIREIEEKIKFEKPQDVSSQDRIKITEEILAIQEQNAKLKKQIERIKWFNDGGEIKTSSFFPHYPFTNQEQAEEDLAKLLVENEKIKKELLRLQQEANQRRREDQIGLDPIERHRVQQATVSIISDNDWLLGTGVIVRSINQGGVRYVYIFTAAHVVDDSINQSGKKLAANISLPDGARQSYPLEILFRGTERGPNGYPRNYQRDFAVGRIQYPDNAPRLSELRLPNEDYLIVTDQKVYGVGCGRERGGGTVPTWRPASRVFCHVEDFPPSRGTGFEIRPGGVSGDSGSPVVDSDGRLIGMLVSRPLPGRIPSSHIVSFLKIRQILREAGLEWIVKY